MPEEKVIEKKLAFDISDLGEFIKKDTAEWLEQLNTVLPRYNINTKQRVAAFIAQVAHESGEFKFVVENLNYSASALQKVFKKYFPTADLANQYARKPEKIANRTYANRMGNGDEASGDGFKYRGRGLIQITGKNNYRECSQFIFKDDRLLDDPSYLETKEGALESACWYWTANNLNAIADKGDTELLTKRINGGHNGLSDREEKYAKALKHLGV